MDAERFSRLTTLFEQARALPAGQRDTFLREACGDDGDLIQEVLELLEEDVRHGDGPMDRALDAEDALDVPVRSTEPTRIGKYRIRGLCGSGGMGTVYDAEQESPSRRVALKVIRSDATRPELLRRFRRETEILARLQHPGIAQIFEAGEFEQDGATRPFFAMEYVDGLAVTDFAKKRDLDVGARIGLFLQICEAIQYAHGQGVVHRDLKPDNIFVLEASDVSDESTSTWGQPKILDFGVARLNDADARATVATNAGALLGSVIYMSPEQASGNVEAIDARSDLYSLGVVLFELLSGELPYQIHQMPLADALHAIRHDDATRLGSVAPGLRGDLETIVGKCLEKDPDRRYATVAHLSDDLRRYQSVLPITARPPSTWYQLQRFTQRNRALVGGAAATAVALVAGAIVAIILALQSAENARVALENQKESQREAYRSNISAASALLETDPAYARRILDRISVDDRGWEHRYLRAALSGLLLEFGDVVDQDPGRHGTRPTGDMYLLAGGEQVVARSAARGFTVWETRTGRVMRTFSAPGDVDLFAVSADGSMAVVALVSGRVVVGALGEGQVAWEAWQDEPGPIDSVAVAPDGETIAVDRPTRLSFGRPGDWHDYDYGGSRNGSIPSNLRFSADGTRVAWTHRNLHVFDAASGELVADPIASNQGHRSIAFSPDGTRVIAGQLRREIRAFDPLTGEYDIELLGHNGAVNWVEYGPEDQLLSVSTDGTLRVWSLGDQVAKLVFEAPGTSKALFLDTDHVLSLTGGKFRLWQVSDRRARELVGHEGHVFVPVFSRDGGLLATSAPWADMAIWDPLETTPIRRFPALRRAQFAFDGSGEELHSSHARWDRYHEHLPWVTGEGISEYPVAERGAFHAVVGGDEAMVDGHRLPTSPGKLQVHRNVHHLGAGAAPPEIFVEGTNQVPTSRDARPSHVELGDSPLLAFGGMRAYEFKGSIVEWLCFRGTLTEEDAAAMDSYLQARRAGEDVGLPEVSATAPLLAHFRASASSVTTTPHGHVQEWRAEGESGLSASPRGRPLYSISLVAASGEAPAQVVFEGGFGTHRWLETALPGAAGAEQLTVCWLGSFSGQKTAQTAYSVGEILPPFAYMSPEELTGKVGPHVSLSRDGKLVVDSYSVEEGGSVTVRDRLTGVALHHFEGSYWGVDFHPDSRRLACGTGEGTVEVFDLSTGELLSRFEAHSGPCLDLAFSPDGTRLATSGNDNALRLWDPDSFDPLLEFPGHRSYIRGIAWSPDSTMLVSACGDYTVRVWDSVPRDQRYSQLLVQRALEDGVRAEVEAMAASHATTAELLDVIRRRWPDDLTRRRAAMKVAARGL